MPELPEVEVILRGLRPHLENQVVLNFSSSNKALRFPLPKEQISKELSGKRVSRLYRRAKYICIIFENRKGLLLHLGMTGNLGFFPKKSPRSRHDHFWCQLDNGLELRYNDIRRFGSIRFLESDTAESLKKLSGELGPEPLCDEFSGQYLRKKAANKSLAVKNFIMDNRIVVGIGNIYANESLFLAGISPKRSVQRISEQRWEKLTQTIKQVLLQAIECGGSTISDFVNASQQSGYFQMNFKVYGKTGQPCCNCGSIIKQVKIGGRASFYCTTCQH